MSIRTIYFSFFFSISFRNDKFNIDTINDRNDLLININTIRFCNENDRNEYENKKKSKKKTKKSKNEKKNFDKMFQINAKNIKHFV